MPENFSISIKLFFESAKTAKTVFRAVKPELSSEKKSRSSTKINIKAETLAMDIKAKDLVALRASFNSFFKAIVLANSLLEGL